MTTTTTTVKKPFRVYKKFKTIKVVNKFGKWNIRKYEREYEDHITLRPDTKKSAITLVLYGDRKEELAKAFIEGSPLFLRKAVFGIRENKLEYALAGRAIADVDEKENIPTLVVDKGRVQMRRPISLYYFENKAVRLLLSETGRIPKLKGEPTFINHRGGVYIFNAEGKDLNSILEILKKNDLIWLDEFQTVGALFPEPYYRYKEEEEEEKDD